MKKMWIKSLAVLFVLVFGLNINVSAEATFQQEFPQTMSGILISDSQEEFHIVGTLVDTSGVAPLAAENHSATLTYEFLIPASIMSSNSSGSVTEEDMDGAYASRVYLTVSYTRRGTGIPYYLLTGVSGHWDMLDSAVSVESAYLTYGCTGRTDDSSGYATQVVNDKRVYNNFNITPDFTHYVAAEVLGVLGANLTVNYLMGTTRRWSFTLQNVPFSEGDIGL